MKKALLNLENGKITNINNLILKINGISFQDDDVIVIDVEEEHNIFYTISILKGDYFPTPTINDIFIPNEFSIKYDENLELRLFAKGELIKDRIFVKCKPLIAYKLIGRGLIDYLKKLFNIKEELKIDIFKIESITQDYFDLYSFKELKHKYLKKKLVNLELIKDDFILIDNFYESKLYINFNKITQIKKLSEELLIRFSLKNLVNDKIDAIKIISIEDNYYIVLNSEYKLFKISISKELKKYNIKLCQILIINNFKIILEKESDMNIIELRNNSILFISSQNIYFAHKKITLNFYSVIKINCLDYKKENNLYNQIEIKDQIFPINKNEIFCIIKSFKINNCDQYAIKLKLLSNDAKKKKKYYFILYHGLLNKINSFINYDSENSVFVEYFFYQINKPLNLINKTIKINDKTYYMKNFDIFDTENRQRINILNTPFSVLKFDNNNEINYESLIKEKKNSFQICRIFSEKEGNLLFGVFNIKEIYKKLIYLKENSDFDNYYDFVGNIVSEIEKIDDINSFKKKYENIYNNLMEHKENSYIISNICSLSEYENEITYSQYKTRLGFILCKNIIECKSIEEMKDLIEHFNYVRNKINGKKLTLFQKLRILLFYINKKFIYVDILFYDELNKNSPYVLALNFNKNEINHLNVYSRYFLAYLQFDSFILYNYLYKENSFSLSLELDFVMKYNLLSNYEGFIFISLEKNDYLVYKTKNEKITAIQEENLFGVTTKRIKYITDINESKNKAFSISMENRHEGCHNKVQQKNLENTPYLFCRDCKMRKIISEKNPKKGESGRIIENFLYNNELRISKLKKKNIYDSLLDYNYFIGSNFDDFKKKVVEIDIKDKEEIKKESNEENNKGSKKECNKESNKENNKECKEESNKVIKKENNKDYKEEIRDESIEESSEESDKENNKENNICELYDNNKLNNLEESKEIEIGNTYFLDDVEYLKLDPISKGRHLSDDENYLPKYFIKQKKIEEEERKLRKGKP